MRTDLNMNIPHHEIVYEKAKRMGNGNIAPLTKTLISQMQVPKEAKLGKQVFEEKPKKFYMSIYDSP